MSQFPSSIEIDIKLELTTIYDSWPKIRQVPKRGPFGSAWCAISGLDKLVGLVWEILIKFQKYIGTAIDKLL